jgi:hypothetical protein
MNYYPENKILKNLTETIGYSFTIYSIYKLLTLGENGFQDRFTSNDNSLVLYLLGLIIGPVISASYYYSNHRLPTQLGTSDALLGGAMVNTKDGLVDLSLTPKHRWKVIVLVLIVVLIISFGLFNTLIAD